MKLPFFGRFKKKKANDDLKKEIVNLISVIKEIEKLMRLVESRINELAFDNEMFKHQIGLEESLRNQESDIRLLKLKIEKTINDLNLENE
jgi:hypothetical protein